jgi:hypothetical protein
MENIEIASRNPYVQGSQPTLLKSVVAFFDILGYKELVKSAHKLGNSQLFLHKLHTVLSNARRFIEIPSEFQQLSSKDVFTIKAFTDNIVLGFPFKDDGEYQLGLTIMDLAEYQLDLIVNGGFFIRGGIAVGEVYIDDLTVFGLGLTEAYEAECCLADFPRIVLANSAEARLVKHATSYYGDPGQSPQSAITLVDQQGIIFVNYLMSAFDDEGELPRLDLIELHKVVVENALRQHRDTQSVFRKYQWVARYHNYFCSECKKLDKKLLIDAGLF